MRAWLVVSCLLLASSGLAAVGDVPIPEMSETLMIRTSQGRADYLDGRLIGETIRDLRRLSPTFNDLLAVLAQSRLIAMFSPSTDVHRISGLIGRTRFYPGEHHVVAMIEVYVDRGNIWTHREAVAHELAHVVEVACLGDIRSLTDIRAAMTRYTGRRPALGTAIPNETAFAVATGRQVVAEVIDGPSGGSQFRSLTARFRLQGCPSGLPGDEAVLAGQVARGSWPE